MDIEVVIREAALNSVNINTFKVIIDFYIYAKKVLEREYLKKMVNKGRYMLDLIDLITVLKFLILY